MLPDIQIENFIFHVVHHGEDQPVLLDETPIDGFENFFKERIAEVLNGNKFHFSDPSDFLEKLKLIDKKKIDFVTASKDLARTFHQHRDGRVKPGVMILVKAKVDAIVKYVLIKYDHAEVITYITKNKKAILSEITNTFVKNRDAMQKSVLVDIEAPVHIASIIDKSDRANVTDFFKNFLGVKRHYDSQTLTDKVKECFIGTIGDHKFALPPEFTREANSKFYEHVQAKKTFTEGTVKELFGDLYTEEIGRTFNKKLKKADILGEEFNFNKKIKKPTKRKYTTIEGVQIQYDSIAANTVEIVPQKDGNTKITITTKKLLDEYVELK